MDDDGKNLVLLQTYMMHGHSLELVRLRLCKKLVEENDVWSSVYVLDLD